MRFLAERNNVRSRLCYNVASVYLSPSVTLCIVARHTTDRRSIVVLCDTRDTSILIVDTYVTIPVSPMSRYTAVYRSSKKYRETAQVSRVSTIPYGSYHSATSNLQACDAKTNVIKSLTVKYCASSSHSVTKYYYTAYLWVVLLSKKDRLLEDRQLRTRTQISKTSFD